jgi:predicted nucleic acid-binding protein
MKRVFADTLYWVAVVHPGDPWHDLALQARAQLQDVRLVTTDEILTEFMTALSGGSAYLRRKAAEMVRAILADSEVEVIPQSHESFLDAIAFYERRLDKQYSLTDCVSMNVMRAEQITEILTNDHHFEQEEEEAANQGEAHIASESS